MRKSLAFVLSWALTGLAPAQAQQFVPKPPPPAASVPNMNAQIVPDFKLPAPGADACALAPVERAELTALRTVIMELLAKDKAARDDFVKAESAIPGDCTRRRAVFYLQALARIKAG